ncbi:hypothetical protein [Rhizobium leguminosarum]|uniref:hypothetical protein n=1 Tax=Rhizobium leguminosarum TaxID=384 RepID=UPI001FEE3E7A|nr:hypothetical protein [Rhizobium leguminosarum]
MRHYDEDEGLNVIRLDGLLRVNAGISSGDQIEIRKADARPATKVVLASAQKNLVLQGSERRAAADLPRSTDGGGRCRFDLCSTTEPASACCRPDNARPA